MNDEEKVEGAGEETNSNLRYYIQLDNKGHASYVTMLIGNFPQVMSQFLKSIYK